MLRLVSAVGLLSLIACAAQQPEGPTGAERQAQMAREDRERREAAAAEQNRQLEAQRTQAAAIMAANKQTDASSVEKQCADTRAARTVEAKKEAADYLAWWSANDARLTYLRKHCEEFDSRGVEVVRERTADGRVIDRLRSNGGVPFDVKCDGAPGRPKGLDARWLAEAGDMIGKYNDPIVAGESKKCEQLDASALGTPLTVAHSDGAGMKRVIALP